MEETKQTNVFTKAKELYKKISEAEGYLTASLENTVYLEHAKISIDEYYALLKDNSDEQINLKERFDVLSNWKKQQLSKLDMQFTTSDELTKMDMVMHKKNIERMYQQERLLECIVNYDKYNLAQHDVPIDS